MTNVHYLRGQLTMALDCIRRGLDAIEDEPDAGGPAGPKTITAMTIQRLAELADSLAATHARTIRLEKIVLAIDPETCAKHDLLPF